MITKDYHGWRLEDATYDVEMAIGRVRLENRQEEARFVTGRGPIKQAVIKTLEDYGLKGTDMLGNPGTLVSILS